MIKKLRESLSYKAILENPWDKIREKVGEKVKMKINNITDKAIFGQLKDFGLSGMLHYKEISYDESVEQLKRFKKDEIIDVKILEIKDDKIRFSRRALKRIHYHGLKIIIKKLGMLLRLEFTKF